MTIIHADRETKIPEKPPLKGLLYLAHLLGEWRAKRQVRKIKKRLDANHRHWTQY